jgi:hypothetical protein
MPKGSATQFEMPILWVLFLILLHLKSAKTTAQHPKSELGLFEVMPIS